jgi:adenine-specific DNA methylase
MPRTRYQGSKAKLVDWIGGHLAHLEFTSALDAFGGTGSVAYGLKRRGVAVTYCDLLRFNHQVGLALIENDHEQLTDEHIEFILRRDPRQVYDDFIERTFAGIYFTDEENRFLDVACQNVGRLNGRGALYRRALVWFALFQAALAKRPYNLFHRRNLYMRTADVPRGFGNKTTWERPFPEHFRRFARQAGAAVFCGAAPCRAICDDASQAPLGAAPDRPYDLVYIDPPYVNARGVGLDYLGFYHFLEGMVDYDRWPERIDWSSRHRRLIPQPSPWLSAATARDAFARLFERFHRSVLVVSYRSDGAVTPEELAALLRAVKHEVRVFQSPRYKYVLSTNQESRELLLIGT